MAEEVTLNCQTLRQPSLRNQLSLLCPFSSITLLQFPKLLLFRLIILPLLPKPDSPRVHQCPKNKCKLIIPKEFSEATLLKGTFHMVLFYRVRVLLIDV